MPRLPEPGSDAGTWGAILNDYLAVSHAADGSLKTGSVTGAHLAANSITPAKLSAATPTAGQVLSYNGTTFAWITNPAGVTDHGLLSGLTDDDHPQYHTDARGDARYYTQAQVNTSLSGKANTSHTHAIADVTNLQTTLDGKQPTDATLTALAAHNTAGLLTQTAPDTFTGRTITGTANQVTVANGDGVAGNPALSLPQDIHTGASPTFAGLTIDTDTLHVDAANNRVGVGTASPLSKLTVGATPGIVDKLMTVSDMATPHTEAWANGIVVSLTGGGGVYLNGYGTGGMEAKYEVFEDKLGIGTMSAHPVEISSNNVVGIRLTTDGKLGVGNNVTPTAGLEVAHANAAASGVYEAQRIHPTVTQSGTAGYTGLAIDVTETSVGSGSRRLLQAQVGGVDRFVVDNTGNLAVAGTVDGRDVAADGAKLDGIQAGADVTDAANVSAAGAEMTANRRTAFQATPDDTHYPTEKLVKESLDTKADAASLAAVAISGSYDDLANTPTIPKITASTTAPSSPALGDMWLDLSS